MPKITAADVKANKKIYYTDEDGVEHRATLTRKKSSEVTIQYIYDNRQLTVRLEEKSPLLAWSFAEPDPVFAKLKAKIAEKDQS